MFPANIRVAPNSPIALAQVIMVPEIMARIDRGKVTVKNTLRREPVNILALLITSLSMFSNPTLADLKRNGDATKVSAIITAIVLPGIMNPGLLNMGPKSPLARKYTAVLHPPQQAATLWVNPSEYQGLFFQGNSLLP